MSHRPPSMIVLVALLVLTGCGVDAQDEPHTVRLPRGPLTAVGPTPAAIDPAGEVGAVFCLIGGGRLAQTVHRLPSAPSVQQQLDALVTGPTPAEQARGLRTALSGLTLAAQPTAGSMEVTIEVKEADENIARSDEVFAYGQIVCTLTARVDVSSVVFTREGRRLSVPRADGTLSTAALRASDYASLI